MSINRNDYCSWLKTLIEQGTLLQREPLKAIQDKTLEKNRWVWVTEAETALHSIFPPVHPVRSQWKASLSRLKNQSLQGIWDSLVGNIQGVQNLVEQGHLDSLVDAIRIETEDELLDQALTLLNVKQFVAATVIAGGALETHLRHLVKKRSGYQGRWVN